MVFIPRSHDTIIASARTGLFSPQFLNSPDIDDVFATNTDRYAVDELAKRHNCLSFMQKSFILQALAAEGDRKTPAQIGDLLNKVGRGKLLCYGGGDQVVEVRLAESSVLQMYAGGLRMESVRDWWSLRPRGVCLRWSSVRRLKARLGNL